MREPRTARTRITRAAFDLRSSAAAGLLVRFVFAHASRTLPVRRVAEGPHVIAFHHPVPAFAPVHVLLVPKLAVRSVMHLSDAQRAQISAEVELLSREAIDKLGLAESGFLVLVNGGRRQDVRQVHFHLLTAGFDLAPAPVATPGVWIDHPEPACEVHQVRLGGDPLLAGLTHAVEMQNALQLDERGYSIVWDDRASIGTGTVHLTAGRARRHKS